MRLSPRPPLSRALVVGLLLGMGLACQVVIGLDEPQGDARPEAAAPVDPCQHAVPPVRPVIKQTSSVDVRWLLMKDVVFPIAGPNGYDIDNACTCMPDLWDGGAPCRNPSGQTSCDGKGGIDNVLPQVFAVEGTQGMGLSGAAHVASPLGALVFITGYNNETDDDDVRVAILAGKMTCEDGGTDESCDRWLVPSGLLEGNRGNPVLSSPAAVVNHQLIATTDLATIPVVLFGRVLEGTHCTITARIDPLDGGPEFRLTDGIAACRIPFDIFSGAIAHAPVTIDGRPDVACNHPDWGRIRQALCRSLDTLSSPPDDFQGRTCDAFSLTWGFGADPTAPPAIPEAASPIPAPATVCTNLPATPETLCSRP